MRPYAFVCIRHASVCTHTPPYTCLPPLQTKQIAGTVQYGMVRYGTVCTIQFTFKSWEKTKIWETGLPNNSRISVFTFYLYEWLIGVGLVMGVTFKTHLSNMNFINFLTPRWKSALYSELAFLQESYLFLNFPLFLNFGRSLIPECAYWP